MMASIAILVLVSLYLYRENQKLKAAPECPVVLPKKVKVVEEEASEENHEE
jgi:hypothetical protein